MGVLVVRVSDVLVTGDIYQLDPLLGCAILVPRYVTQVGGCPSCILGDPSMIGEVTLHGFDNIVTIKNYFLHDFRAFKRIDVVQFGRVTSVLQGLLGPFATVEISQMLRTGL